MTLIADYTHKEVRPVKAYQWFSNGDFYLCKPDIFAAVYERAEGES